MNTAFRLFLLFLIFNGGKEVGRIVGYVPKKNSGGKAAEYCEVLMPKFKLLLWFAFYTSNFFSGKEGIGIEVEDEVFGFNSVYSLGVVPEWRRR